MTSFDPTHAPMMPTHVGSPALRVLAIVPTVSDPTEYVAVVAQTGHSRPLYGTVRTYTDTSGQWVAHTGTYDFSSFRASVLNMIGRAGWDVV
jgi:hypothetical protein